MARAASKRPTVAKADDWYALAERVTAEIDAARHGDRESIYRRIAVEMGSTDGWWKYGCAAVVGIDSFGESAPAPVLFEHFGFTAENVAATVQAALKRKKK